MTTEYYERYYFEQMYTLYVLNIYIEMQWGCVYIDSYIYTQRDATDSEYQVSK